MPLMGKSGSKWQRLAYSQAAISAAQQGKCDVNTVGNCHRAPRHSQLPPEATTSRGSRTGRTQQRGESSTTGADHTGGGATDKSKREETLDLGSVSQRHLPRQDNANRAQMWGAILATPRSSSTGSTPKKERGADWHGFDTCPTPKKGGGGRRVGDQQPAPRSQPATPPPADQVGHPSCPPTVDGRVRWAILAARTARGRPASRWPTPATSGHLKNARGARYVL